MPLSNSQLFGLIEAAGGVIILSKIVESKAFAITGISISWTGQIDLFLI